MHDVIIITLTKAYASAQKNEMLLNIALNAKPNTELSRSERWRTAIARALPPAGDQAHE